MQSGIFQTKPDASQIKQILTDNEGELRRLVGRYISQFNGAYDADDAFQDALTNLLRFSHTYNGTTTLGTWVTNCVKRQLFKKLGRTKENVAAEDYNHPSHNGDIERVDIKDFVENIKDERTRSAVKLRYYESLTLSEIGSRLGISTAYVDVLIRGFLKEAKVRLS